MSKVNPKILFGKICPYCGRKPKYVDSELIYGKSYGMIYLCRGCDAYVGVHKGSDKPLGRLADKDLREAKKKAHYYFDALWKAKTNIGILEDPRRSKRKVEWQRACRSQAYKWLSEVMQIKPEFTHIGMFDVEQCEKVVQLCLPYYNKIYSN